MYAYISVKLVIKIRRRFDFTWRTERILIMSVIMEIYFTQVSVFNVSFTLAFEINTATAFNIVVGSNARNIEYRKQFFFPN